ncbi:MAG: hypothetical protein ACOYM3_11600 [Terrimicrobiaceae bacterium]
MSSVTKRRFLKQTAILGMGYALCVSLSGVASAALGKMRLRASAKTALPGARLGLKRRLKNISDLTVKDAFRMANRKTEIEITIL